MDIASLLRSLNDHKVRYVIIGAAALPVHGFSRVTLDIDFLIQPTKRNAERTLDALRAVGYDVADISAKELLKKTVLLRQYPVEADFHPFVSGATFEGVWRRKVPDKIQGVKAYFASLNDLMRMKKAAGRPKDLEDLRVLEKLRERKKKPSRTR